MIKLKTYTGKLSWIMAFAMLTSCNVKNNKVQKETVKQNATKQIHSNVDIAIEVAENQYKGMLKALEAEKLFPKTVNPNGELVKEKLEGWTSGFFPGSLWLLYQYTGKENWKKEAEKWTDYLEPAQYFTFDHDMGFRTYCSYGKGYKITSKEEYKEVLVQSAKSLSKRFNPKVGLIKSWDQGKAWDGKTEWKYPVIIDNMMNLELLFFAYNQTKNKKFRDIAITHAENTMRDFFREDYSTFHVVDYDTTNGKVKDKATCQGFADNSAWARGQSWGLYGFTVMYRETKEVKYLEQAKHIANFIMNHPNLPSDKVPFWDYNAGLEGYQSEWKFDKEKYKEMPRDASAAAIMASALYELSTFVSETDTTLYKKFADQIVASLCSNKYLSAPNANKNFILKHSVGSLPHGAEIDTPIVYADYYFLEALIRKKNLERTGTLVSK